MINRSVSLSLALGLFFLLGMDHGHGLSVGDAAPAFAANNASGELWKLEEHLGKKNIVVYFYPAAMTGGCTKQACSFRDRSAALNEADAVVVGVSGDSVNALKVFQEAHGLNFTLLSDPNGSIAEAFGVPVRGGGSIEREVDGRTHLLNRGVTTMRWTFIINKDGEVVYKNDRVNAAEDGEVVLAELKKLAARS